MQISRSLLTREKIRALSSAENFDEINSILSGMGYNTELPTDDEIIENERDKTVKTAIGLTTDGTVARCIEILNKRHELRDRLANRNPNATSFELDTLCELELFKQLNQYTPKIKNKNIANYFSALADLTNIKTFAKYKLANVTPAGVFADGGIIAALRLSSVFTGDADAVKNLFSSTPYHKISVALDKALTEKNLTVLEDAISAQLDEIVSVDKDNLFKPNLVFWWFIKKQTEFIVIKTIMTNKRLKMSPIQLREQLRGLYERFN
jgi:vacuolar-type H+-ATPase subunit C/Vma6